MDWAGIGEAIKAVAPVFTAGAACVGAGIAYKGLQKWRHETVGRRRIELAEDVIADFYEAVDVFRWVRSPMAYAYETEARPGREQDAGAVQHHRDTFYVPLKRLSDHAEFFAKVRARRYRVMATFGPDAGRFYDEIHRIHSRIAISAQALMRLDPNDQTDRAFARQERLEQDVWAGYGQPDTIADELDALLGSVETRFRTEVGKDLK